MTSKLGALRDMYPILAIDDLADHCMRHAIGTGEFSPLLALSRKFSDFGYLFFVQFCHVMLRTLRSWWICATSLTSHVVNVVLMRSEKQVGRIAAGRIVAVVADIHALWNWPIMQFVAKAMGVNTCAIDGENSVTGFAQLLRPYPTAIWRIAINVLPKAFFRRAIGRSMMSLNIWNGFAPKPSAIASGYFGDRRLLTTTTLAITIGYFVSVHMSILARNF